MKRSAKKSKAQDVAADLKSAVSAGSRADSITVDFSDSNRPKTCLEVDFPILPVNQISNIEGNASKPVYSVSKWWARRRSSVFRSLLLSAATKAPDDPVSSGPSVWASYYKNHQSNRNFRDLRVADPFMGGGTTIIEGSRLGMNMYGADLNPVAWFIVKTETTKVDIQSVNNLLNDIEADVKPQIMPFYTCDCPRGHKGIWTNRLTGEKMSPSFDPLTLSPKELESFDYYGPEIIYTFWAKHGICSDSACDHRTPIIKSPVVATKQLTVKSWKHTCIHCERQYDIEEKEARAAPGTPLIVSATESPFSVLQDHSVECPHCHKTEEVNPDLYRRRMKNKRIQLSVLLHPQWLRGASKTELIGKYGGGTVRDEYESTSRWNAVRAETLRLLELRGDIPEKVTCPETGETFSTNWEGGTQAFRIDKDSGKRRPKKSTFACQSNTCGKENDVLSAIRKSGTSAPVAQFMIQGYCPMCAEDRMVYRGRFFAPITDHSKYDKASMEWARRRADDLLEFWPKSKLPYGYMTSFLNGGIPNHGYTHWWTMFNPRQLLTHALILRQIITADDYDSSVREVVLSVFQQYLRNQNMFCFWDFSRDTLVPMLSNANFHPKAVAVENCVFHKIGRGNWKSCVESLLDSLKWTFSEPWEIIPHDLLPDEATSNIVESLTGKSSKVHTGDPVQSGITLACQSATDLSSLQDEWYDLVVTDPPFGGLLHYSELSDFFYVWLRLALKHEYSNFFGAEYAPKVLEAVSNRARNPDDADLYYRRLLTEAWKESNRILKAGGILAFTFHHSEDEPWIAVLESLFDAGFWLEATYPIRSDEIKGLGTFGSRKIEYDIIHVCRKRRDIPSEISWPRLRRRVITDVSQLTEILRLHQEEGLPDADIRVIMRGKALEYYSRHYGRVFDADGGIVDVRDALVRINSLLDEEESNLRYKFPLITSPITTQFLRVFDKNENVLQDQIQKTLRGTGFSSGDFVERDWCIHNKAEKTFSVVQPVDFARERYTREKFQLIQDYDQALFLVGVCAENSGVDATVALSIHIQRPHPALGSLLDWLELRGWSDDVRKAARRARAIFEVWKASRREFGEEGPQLHLPLDGTEEA